MAAVTWHQNLSVGIERLDDQHKKLISMINNLYKVITEEESHDFLETILKEMIEYTTTHFSTEEKYFRSFNFPGADEHIRQHAQFIEKLDEFLEDFKTGESSLTFQIMDFLQDWLIHHIMETDKKYSAFLREHGLH